MTRCTDRLCARCEDADWMWRTGESVPLIASRLGITVAALEISLRKCGHSDWPLRFEAASLIARQRRQRRRRAS